MYVCTCMYVLKTGHACLVPPDLDDTVTQTTHGDRRPSALYRRARADGVFTPHPRRRHHRIIIAAPRRRRSPPPAAVARRRRRLLMMKGSRRIGGGEGA